MAEPRTIRIAGNGTRSATYQLPPSILQFIESVKAEISNGAGVAATPLLTISEQTGVVIAKQEQSSSIPAAGTGTASWFLRQGGSGGATGTGFIKFDTDPQTGLFLHTDTTSFDPITGWAYDFKSTQGANTIDVAWGNAVLDVEINGGVASLLFRKSRFVVNTDHNEVIEIDLDFAQLSCAHTTFRITEGVGANIRLGVGVSFQVEDHNGQALFRVDEDGDLHGLTGKSLTFDL